MTQKDEMDSETNTILEIYFDNETMETHHRTIYITDPDEVLYQLDPSDAALTDDQTLVYFEHSR